MFYGGRINAAEGKDALTPAQEEVLYREGAIPPVDEAEAQLVAADGKQAATPPAVRPTQISTAGHKFPLPEKPYPADFHQKRRYHPVLEQITRLLMYDGKLSVAQRVCILRLIYTRPRLTFNE